MFFGEDRIAAVREMILADDDDAAGPRGAGKLLPMQRKDFVGIFRAMDGLPVTIRLLDPPLHEFLPSEAGAVPRLAAEMGTVTVKALEEKAASLHESNPMLGTAAAGWGSPSRRSTRCRCAPSSRPPRAASKKGIDVQPEVMIPLVGTVEEYRLSGRVRIRRGAPR